MGDVTLYVLCNHDENELVAQGCLDALVESLDALLRGHVSRRSMLENYDYVLLAIDETVDSGVLLETDPLLIAQRCAMSDRPGGGVGQGAGMGAPLHEQTLSQLMGAADQIIRNLKN